MDQSRSPDKIFKIEWSSLIKSLPDIYLIVDRSGQILFINRVADGVEMDEVLKHTVYEFTAIEFHAQLCMKIHSVYDTGCEERIEVKRSDPNFADQWWSVAMSPLKQGDDIVAVLYLCRDVTDLQNIRQEQQKAINSLKQKFWQETSAHDRAREILIEEIEVRRAAESSLRDSEERYRVLVENARNAIFSVNYEGIFVFLNPVAAKNLGGEPKDYAGKHMTELFPLDIANRQLETVRRVIDTRQEELTESRTIVQGRPNWYLTSIRPIVEPNGNCTAVLMEATDIDDRVQAMKQLQRERNFSSSILQTANTLILCLDSKACITVFNAECEAVTGYKFEEVVGKSWSEIFLPEELRHAGLKDFAEWVRVHPHDRYEGAIVTKSGEKRVIYWSNSSFVFEDTGELLAIAIGTDVTELKRTEEKLRESELRMSLALKGTGAGMWDWDMISDRVFYAPEWKTMLGYAEDDFDDTFLTWKRLWHPDDVEKIEKAMEEHLSGKTEQYVIEHRLRHKDGSWRCIMTRGGIFKDATGTSCRWVGCNVDITERHRMRESLAESQARSAAILKGIPDLIFIIGRDGYYREFTGGYPDDLLVTAERVVGSHVSDSIPEPLASRLMSVLLRVIATGESEIVEYTLEPQGVVTDFEARFVRCGEDECLVIVRNVSERKKLEKEIQEATEKLRLEHLELKEKNIALRVILSQIQQEADEVKANVNANVEKLIVPVIDRFRRSASEKDRDYADKIESLVLEMTSSFASNLHKKSSSLTPREIEICSMIRSDLQSKEIADRLRVSLRTVEKFRQRIRTKLGIANHDINLATFLKALET